MYLMVKRFLCVGDPSFMKVKTRCPHCSEEFITEVPDGTESYDISCPACQKLFRIKKNCDADPDADCFWEEHGEPRKTILSSLKPLSNKPVLAAFLLLTTCILGIFTAVFVFTTRIEMIPYISSIVGGIIGSVSSVTLALILLVFSVCACIAFILVLKRRHYKVALVCCLFSIFSIGFFIGSILCVVAFFLIITARDEFDNGNQGKIF